jgi:hypothetical protein
MGHANLSVLVAANKGGTVRRMTVLAVLMLCLAGIVMAKTPPAQVAPTSEHYNSPTSNYHSHVSPDIVALQAQERAAFARGDVAAARDLERQVQALLIEQQNAVPQPAVVNVVGPPCSGAALAPDQPIHPGAVSASSADWEMDGTMWAAFASQTDQLTWIYKSTDHGANWTVVTRFYWDPIHVISKIELVVGQGDSGFVYVFENVPTDNGDLKVARVGKNGGSVLGWNVRAGADTVTDFTACRDFSGDNYWLYAVSYNGAQTGD